MSETWNRGLDAREHWRTHPLIRFAVTFLLRPSSSTNTFPSVCACLSVRQTFLTMFLSSYHLEICRSYYHQQTWCPCKMSRSKVKVTEVMTSFSRFRTVTQAWIHIWRWNDKQSLMLHRIGALLFFKVMRQISRSHGSKIVEFDPDWGFPDCNSSLNSQMATKWCTKLEIA